MNKISFGLGFICLSICFLVYLVVKTELLNTGTISDPGYCTPLVVNCKDGTQFLGKAVMREKRLGKGSARQCDIEIPLKNTSPAVWAGTVCFAHQGIASMQQPIFNSDSLLQSLIDEQKGKLYDDLMRIKMRSDNAQAAYDEFVKRTIGEYYKPIVPAVSK